MENSINSIPIKASGVRYLVDGEDSFTRWVLIDKDQSPEDDLELISRLGFVHRYQGPGMPFTEPGFVRRVGKRVLVTQFCARDI